MADENVDPTPTPILGIKMPKMDPQQMADNSIVTVNGWKALLARYGPGAVAAGYLIYYLTQTQGTMLAQIRDNQMTQSSAMQSIISGHAEQQRSLDALVTISRANCVNAAKNDNAAVARCMQ